MTLNCQWLHHRIDAQRFLGACTITPRPILPRYDAIFAERLGLPALVVVLMPLFHSGAFAVALGMCAVLAAVGVALAARLAGAGRGVAVLAVVLLFTVRGTTWLARFGSEAPALLGMVAAMCALLSVRIIGPRRAALPFVVAVGWLYAVRPSSAITLAATLTVVYGVVAVRRRTRTDVLVGGSVAAVLVAELVAQRLSHSPGLTETLQDTFSEHFRRRPVGHLWDHYFRLLGHTMPKLASGMLHHPITPLVALVGAAVAIAHPRLRLPAVGIVGVALASAIVHPVRSEVPRLLSPATAIEAMGLAMLLGLVASRAVTSGAGARLRTAFGGGDGGGKPITDPIGHFTRF